MRHRYQRKFFLRSSKLANGGRAGEPGELPYMVARPLERLAAIGAGFGVGFVEGVDDLHELLHRYVWQRFIVQQFDERPSLRGHIVEVHLHTCFRARRTDEVTDRHHDVLHRLGQCE